jgi:hypothetical protein
MIIHELEECKIQIKQAILDAGYLSEENLKLLYDMNIPFLTRLIPRKGLYENLINTYVPNIKKKANFVKYGERRLFIQKVNESLFSSKIPVNCFVCLDIEKFNIDSRAYFNKFDENILEDKLNSDMLRFGTFILVSTIDLDINEILPTYYNRQSVEQIFDYIKNEIDIVPLRTHSVQTFSGHIFISFLATICFIAINKALKKYGMSFNQIIDSLQRFNCHVFNQKIIPDVPTKKVNDALKALKIKIPPKITINTLYNNNITIC